MRNFIVLFFCSLIFIACGSEGSTADTDDKPETSEINPMILVEGGGVYKRTCIACHMENGLGVPGLNPPLAGTKYVLGDKEELIKIVLNGQQGELVVKGETYNSVMNSHSFLSDVEISNVLTYVRNSFGNEASAVTAEEVAAVRAANTGP